MQLLLGKLENLLQSNKYSNSVILMNWPLPDCVPPKCHLYNEGQMRLYDSI